MANAFTPNLNLTKPEVGADSNLWGGHTNGDWDIVDSIYTATSTMMVSMVLKSDTSIVDFTTTSKRMLFNLTGISTSTTRNLSVQDADGTLAYTAQIAAATTGLGTVTTGQVAAATVGMVDTSSVQTLSNKTINSPVINTDCSQRVKHRRHDDGRLTKAPSSPLRPIVDRIARPRRRSWTPADGIQW